MWKTRQPLISWQIFYCYDLMLTLEPSVVKIPSKMLILFCLAGMKCSSSYFDTNLISLSVHKFCKWWLTLGNQALSNCLFPHTASFAFTTRTTLLWAKSAINIEPRADSSSSQLPKDSWACLKIYNFVLSIHVNCPASRKFNFEFALSTTICSYWTFVQT